MDVPAVTEDGYILVPIVEGGLHKLSSDGKLVWSSKSASAGNFFTLPTPLSDGKIGVAVRYGTMFEGAALLDTEGHVLWEVALRDKYNARFDFVGPVTVDQASGTVVVATDSELFALSGHDGSGVWNKTDCNLNLGGEEWQQGQPLTLPLVINGSALALCAASEAEGGQVEVRSFRVSDGSQQWATPLDVALEATHRSPAFLCSGVCVCLFCCNPLACCVWCWLAAIFGQQHGLFAPVGPRIRHHRDREPLWH